MRDVGGRWEGDISLTNLHRQALRCMDDIDWRSGDAPKRTIRQARSFEIGSLEPADNESQP
jgi:hypothetical protein